MTRRSRLWLYGAAAFTLINVAGAGYAVAMGEPMHAAVHAILLTLGFGAYTTWRATRRWADKDGSPELRDGRIEYLQQSVDAIALEVERIGEAQRFNEKLREERGEIPPAKKEQ